MQIRERVKELRALADKADGGAAEAEAEEEGDNTEGAGLEQTEVQYSDDELVTTVVTTTEVTPISLDGNAAAQEDEVCQVEVA